LLGANGLVDLVGDVRAFGLGASGGDQDAFAYSGKVITHVVMFKLADPADIPEALDRIRAMAGRIPSLESIAAGRDSSRGPAAFDAVLISKHEDSTALADYATDPIHQELLAWLKPRWTERAVVDSEDLA
jgi:hypothetical protein